MAPCSVPFTKVFEVEDETEDCKAFISTLPKKKWYGSIYLHKYKGFWLGELQLQGLIACQRQFQAQETDVVLVTPPKSGTTWLKAILFALQNRKRYPITDADHPLLTTNPHFLVPFLEFSPGFPPGISSKSVPWLYSTHSPLTLLPKSIKASACKIVYLCRSPKDVFVSYWHFTKKLDRLKDDTWVPEEFLDMFCKGVSLCGPFWDHVLHYWKESLKKPYKVFFLKYEDMKAQPSIHLRRLADFLGCPFSLEEETSKVADEILRLCSFDNLRNLEVNKIGKTLFGDSLELYFRKGEVGDWKNHLTCEMADRIDLISLQKFHGSGLNL